MVPGTVCSLLQIQPVTFFMANGLVYSEKINSKVKYQ